MLLQLEVVRSLALLKKAAAHVNRDFGLKSDIADLITAAAQEVRFTYLVTSTNNSSTLGHVGCLVIIHRAGLIYIWYGYNSYV